jgi:hypothetical protein
MKSLHHDMLRAISAPDVQGISNGDIKTIPLIDREVVR